MCDNPDFAFFMDTANMQAVWQTVLPDCQSGCWVITGCEIQHPRFKTYLNPGSYSKSFLALAYHLQGFDPTNQQSGQRVLYAKAYLNGRNLSEYQKLPAVINKRHAPLHLPDYGLLVWHFPSDPAMPQLIKLADKAGMQHYFAWLLPGQCITEVEECKIINYRPEIRCMFRYSLRTFYNKIAIYGKSYSDDRGIEIYRRIAAYYEHRQQQAEGFVVPRPLAYDSNLQVLWLQGLDGQALVDVLNPNSLPSIMAQLTKNLALFHRMPVEGLDVLPEETLWSEIQKKCLKLQCAFPKRSKRINRLLNSLAQQKASLLCMSKSVIHGDFHIQQMLLLDNNQLAIFDFDELQVANPLVDLANFSADLYNLGLDDYFIRQIIGQLLESYQIATNTKISSSHFAWHLRVQLLTRAYRAFIQQKPNLKTLVDQFISLAEAGFNRHGQCHASIA